MMTTPRSSYRKLSGRNWVVIITLGLSGQIAWNVENNWFNTFVYDTITPDSRPIAVMVAVSAVVATLTTLFIGALSDRLGRRKPFIVAGYLLWALCTALFPAAAIPTQVGFAVFLAIALDAVMTFFGSTANDASFNAWVTDNTEHGNRGLVEGVLNTLPVLAVMIGMGLSGLVIDSLGYTWFFLTLGGLVLAMGLLGGLLVRDHPNLRPQRQSGFWRQLGRLFTPSAVKANRDLYLVFLAACIFSTGSQVSQPYEVIYLNHALGISKTVVGILTAVVAPVLILFAIPIGWLTDKGKGFQIALVGYVISAVGYWAFAATDQVGWLIVFAIAKSVGFLIAIVLGAWQRDLLPVESIGAYQGVRLFFWVLLPMIIGPAIGSTLIQWFGTPGVINERLGMIPPPAIYWASALIVLVALVPIWLLQRSRKKP